MILSCIVFGSAGGVDWANWYIIESYPLFLYPRDRRAANASGQHTDIERFLPPIQNPGEDNIGRFFHPVSKAGRTRGSCSMFLHRSLRTFSSRKMYTLFSGTFLLGQQPLMTVLSSRLLAPLWTLLTASRLGPFLSQLSCRCVSKCVFWHFLEESWAVLSFLH